MNEDDFGPVPENQIGLSGQFRVMQAIAVAHAVDESPDGQLGLGVL